MTVAGGGQVSAPAWHEPVRELVQAAWFALDEAQAVLGRQAELYQAYLQPGAGRLRAFKEDFDALASELIVLVIDEIFPVPEEEQVGEAEEAPLMSGVASPADSGGEIAT